MRVFLSLGEDLFFFLLGPGKAQAHELTSCSPCVEGNQRESKLGNSVPSLLEGTPGEQGGWSAEGKYGEETDEGSWEHPVECSTIGTGPSSDIRSEQTLKNGCNPNVVPVF